MNHKILVGFHFSYKKVIISLWPSGRREVTYPSGARRDWLKRCCKYLEQRGKATYGFFQGGHGYTIYL